MFCLCWSVSVFPVCVFLIVRVHLFCAFRCGRLSLHQTRLRVSVQIWSRIFHLHHKLCPINKTENRKAQPPRWCKAVKQAEFGVKIVPLEYCRTGAFLGLVQLSKRIQYMSILSDGLSTRGGGNHKSQGLRSSRNPNRGASPQPPHPFGQALNDLPQTARLIETPRRRPSVQLQEKSCSLTFWFCSSSRRQQIRGC